MSLAAQGVGVVRGGQHLLRDVDVAVRAGEVLAIIGPNGAGKSTLLSSLAGDQAPSTGSVTLDGQPLGGYSLEALARRRAVMRQVTSIVFDFLVHEVLEMGWLPDHAGDRGVRREALDTLVAACELGRLLTRRFNTLSGGEQQRVHMARALLQIWPDDTLDGARYLLLDEPTSSLDLAHELLLLRLIARRAHEDAGAVVVMHDLNLAARFADRILLLHQGEVRAAGTTDEVMNAELLTDVYRTPVRIAHDDNRVLVLT
ncbi:MAG: heme ABC transporter ATP-binding protein [Pseudomonadota bacterium]